MNFLIDECPHTSLVLVAVGRGHEATHVNYRGLGGVQDWNLMAPIREGAFTFVTNNTGDFRRLYAREDNHAGLVILIPNVPPSEQRELFDAALDELAATPGLIKKDSNPGGLPIEVFDGFRQGMANRAQFYRDVPEGPFYGFNRPGAKVMPGVIDNWWRQGMMGGTKAHYDCIKVFSETDHTEDLKTIEIPVLVMHSKDDQIVPFADAGPLSAKLLKNGVLKVYEDLPHGMPTTHAEIINADLLAFLKT